jgi:Mg-chelatase subunit ChlD
VETLMKVQLGGGTDIAKAMAYASQLVEMPRRTIVALITDFYEGGNAALLVQEVRELCQQGTTVLGLAALDPEARPAYDRALAQRLADEGAHIAR